MAAPHPRHAELTTTLTSHRQPATTWEGAVYRFSALRWATVEKIVSGEGAKRNGGRWTPLGAFRTVYGSLTPETATAEVFQHYRYYGLPLEEGTPRVLVAVRVNLQVVLDLRDPAVLGVLSLDGDELREEDWRAALDSGRESLTQAVSRAAYESGFEGLLAPSHADPEGDNLAAYPERLPADREPAVVNPEDLAFLSGGA